MGMPPRLSEYTADQKYLVDAAGRAAGLVDPVAFDPGYYRYYLLRRAIRGPLTPLDGALVRQWETGGRAISVGTHFGARLYTAGDIPFVHVVATLDGNTPSGLFDFHVVSRRDFTRLFRVALKAMREREVADTPPVMHDEQLDTLRRNTLGYLDPKNLKRIKDLGGRAKRGLLLTGPPGNGKTSACRWLWQECLKHGHEYKMVTPDAYRAARNSPCPVAAVKDLFSVSRRGVIFFDDMDIALRDRDTVKETDDQAVFLGALDGIEANEGVVYVFTTNCGLSLIDPAFKRPGRIDLVLHFQKPDAELRRRLIDRWHEDVRAGFDLDAAVSDTAGLSFAEIEELKNLLILGHLDRGGWDWDRAMHQFEENRSDLASEAKRRVGFGILEPMLNGN
jgi:cell division protease FtsH